MSVTYEYSFLITTVAFVGMAFSTVLYVLISPSKTLLPYLSMLFLFTGAQYGTLDTDLTFYSRGTGLLPFSLLNIYLYLLFALILFRHGLSYKARWEPSVLYISIRMLVVLILLYSTYGLAAGVAFENVVSKSGLINIVNLYLLLLMLKWMTSNETGLNQLLNVFVVVTSFMAIYGLVRWGVFGGDPANYYRNYGEQATTLTYFDASQGVLFAILSVLMYEKLRLGMVKAATKYLYYAIIGVSLANIMLSYRRALWLGLALVFLWLILTSKMSRKVLFAAVALTMLAIGSVIYQARFDESYKSRWSAGVVSDITTESGKIDIKEGRFAELYSAVQIANRSPILGLGPWGVNSPRVQPLRETDFVHSSIVHVYIKLGLIGVALFSLTLVAYTYWWVSRRRQRWVSGYYRSVGDAFFCGFLFELPDILFGTPLIIFRHGQLIALVLIVPYVCYRIDRSLGCQNQPRELGQRPANGESYALG